MRYLAITSTYPHLRWIPAPFLLILFPTLYYFNFIQGGIGISDEWMNNQSDGSGINEFWTGHFRDFISSFQENYRYVEGLEFDANTNREDMRYRLEILGKVALDINVLIHWDNGNPYLVKHFLNGVEQEEIPNIISHITPESFHVVQPMFQDINNLIRQVYDILDNDNPIMGFDGNQEIISNLNNILSQLFNKFSTLGLMCCPEMEGTDWLHWIESNVGEGMPNNVIYLRNWIQNFLPD